MGFFNFGGFNKKETAPENKVEAEVDFKGEVRKLVEWRRDVEGGMGMERDARDAGVLEQIKEAENKLKEKMGEEEYERIMGEVRAEIESGSDIPEAA